MRASRTAYKNFFAHNGLGPYECFECGKDVSFEEVVVHHLDEDHRNDEWQNLSAAHDKCHKSYHSKRQKRRTGILKTPAEKLAMAAGQRRRWSQIDRSPTFCDCGAGPFRGDFGLAGHRRQACLSA